MECIGHAHSPVGEDSRGLLLVVERETRELGGQETNDQTLGSSGSGPLSFCFHHHPEAG